MLSRDRLRAAFDDWKQREVTSKRLFGTGVGIAVIGLPLGLWSVVVGPTADDRLAAAGFSAFCGAMSAYSLWAAKSVVGGPSERDEDPL